MPAELLAPGERAADYSLTMLDQGLIFDRKRIAEEGTIPNFSPAATTCMSSFLKSRSTAILQSLKKSSSNMQQYYQR